MTAEERRALTCALLGLAAIVFLGAAVAGWAIDLVFTKSEEEAGEID